MSHRKKPVGSTPCSVVSMSNPTEKLSYSSFGTTAGVPRLRRPWVSRSRHLRVDGGGSIISYVTSRDPGSVSWWCPNSGRLSEVIELRIVSVFLPRWSSEVLTSRWSYVMVRPSGPSWTEVEDSRRRTLHGWFRCSLLGGILRPLGTGSQSSVLHLNLF